MSCFTRTGLIPAVTNSSIRNQRIRGVPTDPNPDMVVSASFSLQPYSRDHSGMNPYSNTCSIMCNHPIADSATKKLLIETKEKLRKGKILNGRVGLNYYYEDEDADGDVDDYLIGGIRERIIVPEILFRHYTQTDSRPLTPTSINFSHSYRFSMMKPTSTFASRRCITPDDQHLSKAPERKRLVLDLRKCLSQSSLTLQGKQLENHKEYHSVMSAVGITSRTNDAASHRKKKPLLSSEITKYRYFSRKNCHYEFTKNNVMPSKKNHSSYTQYIEVNLPERNGKSKKDKKKSRKAKKEKKRQKNFDPSTKHFNENLETEMARDVTIESDANVPMTEHTDGSSMKNSFDENSSSLEYSIDEGRVHEEHIRVLLEEIDSDVFREDVGVNKYRRLFGVNTSDVENNRSIVANDATNRKCAWDTSERRRRRRRSSLFSLSALADVNRPAEMLSSSPRSELLRVISRRNARFTLPSDKTTLEGMRPLEYLRRHVHVSQTSRKVYSRIFEAYATTMKNNPDIHDEEPTSCLNEPDDLYTALRCAMGKNFQEEEWTSLQRLLALDLSDRIDLHAWHGICALCERLYGDRLTFKHLTKIEDPCHEIETADFEFLEQKLATSDINVELKEMLFLIRDS